MKSFYKILVSGLFILSLSCADFLDIVPDNVATIDNAFRMRVTAEQYLSTCYSYIPNHGSEYSNPAFFGADEWWMAKQYGNVWSPWNIARGEQSKNNPQVDYWRGANGGKPMWEGISQCNIFLENIMKVPDMSEKEKKQWVAEIKFLKAYYHFYLLRAYGPIPIIKENFPISASGEDVRVFRQPVDDVFTYILELIDEGLLDLVSTVKDESTELGRITLPIALGMKAKILTYAASPLFNGNTDYLNFKNQEGVHFFNQEYKAEKWSKAAEACKEAINNAHSLGHALYEFPGGLLTQNISPETKLKLTIRGIVTERWNSEVIWANTNSRASSMQTWTHPTSLDPSEAGYLGSTGSFGTTLKIANMFYSENGVPIDEDKEWDYQNRFELRVGSSEERYYIKEGYTTAEFNFEREPRFYGSLGFDGGIWYGHGRFDDQKPSYLRSKRGQLAGKQQAGWHSVPGYYAKKLDYYTNTSTSADNYSITSYAWPVLRLGDLYLLYAESLNELNGPGVEVYEYLDKIRARAGLQGVESSWSTYSKNPTKYTTKEGLREIIQRERTIETLFEGQRFWDVRRWKTFLSELNKPITGWDVDQSNAEDYYREKVIFNQRFEFKDYFWPIREYDIIVNRNLIQNPGW